MSRRLRRRYVARGPRRSRVRPPIVPTAHPANSPNGVARVAMRSTKRTSARSARCPHLRPLQEAAQARADVRPIGRQRRLEPVRVVEQAGRPTLGPPGRELVDAEERRADHEEPAWYYAYHAAPPRRPATRHRPTSYQRHRATAEIPGWATVVYHGEEHGGWLPSSRASVSQARLGWDCGRTRNVGRLTLEMSHGRRDARGGDATLEGRRRVRVPVREDSPVRPGLQGGHHGRRGREPDRRTG